MSQGGESRSKFNKCRWFVCKHDSSFDSCQMDIRFIHWMFGIFCDISTLWLLFAPVIKSGLLWYVYSCYDFFMWIYYTTKLCLLDYILYIWVFLPELYTHTISPEEKWNLSPESDNAWTWLRFGLHKSLLTCEGRWGLYFCTLLGRH